MARTSAGALLRQWREEADFSVDRAAVYAADAMAFGFSSETLRRYENGYYTAARMDPFRVLVLVNLYGKRISDLPKDLAERVEKAHHQLGSVSHWSSSSVADELAPTG